jgi:hypothetical protein
MRRQRTEGRKFNEKFLRGKLENEGWKGGRVEGEKLRRLKGGLKASIPGVQETFHQSHNIQYFDEFTTGFIHLKKPSGGPKGLIGPPCHGAPGRRKQRKEVKK